MDKQARLLTVIPYVMRDGVPYIKATDFRNHKDEVILKLLPRHNAVAITNRGQPTFSLRQPRRFYERLTYPMTRSRRRLRGMHVQWGEAFCRISDFFHHRTAVLKTGFSKERTYFTVTWYGWADFEVHQEAGEPIGYADLWGAVREKKLATMKTRRAKA